MNAYGVRALVLVSSLALSLGLGPGATAVEAGEWPGCGGSTLPATGQEVSYGNMTMTQIANVPVRDDGLVRAGGALSYQDNGDGTITDLNTGLMWEKKIDDEGLHDWNLSLPWSSVTRTIWDWLVEVNAEGGVGLAGYNDWRIPNVKELMSIVDYGTANPTVDLAFNNGIMGPCTVSTCSRTQTTDAYWSSTTNVGVGGTPGANAWEVFFLNGDVNNFSPKSFSKFVRAVRGGCVP